jgi:hypothetical protein
MARRRRQPAGKKPMDNGWYSGACMLTGRCRDTTKPARHGVSGGGPAAGAYVQGEPSYTHISTYIESNGVRPVVALIYS